jgi:outer membrane protein assembly factor BamB
MFKIKFQVLFVILIGVIAGCAGPLKIIPSTPTTPTANMVIENPVKDFEDQFRHNEPRYSISLPQQEMLHQSLYDQKKERLYLWLFENKQYELIAIDLANSEILWSFKLPKKTRVYRMGTTVAGDIWLDLNYNGSTLVFVDPDQGVEKWRHGKGAKEGDRGYCKFFDREFNFVVEANGIEVQDPNTYQTLNKIERFTVDRNRNLGRGYIRFDNIYVYEIGDQFIIVDNGLHAISKDTGQKLWSTRLPTIASRYHTGKNIATAIVGALVGVYGAGRGPDFVWSQPLIVRSKDVYFVSALSNLYRINALTGHIEWAEDLDIGFANHIDVSEDRVYLESCSGYESGIFAFEQENGAPVPSFHTPFTRSVNVEILTDEKMEEITENEMWHRNLACYNALIGKKSIVLEDKRLYRPVITTKDEIVALSANAIHEFDKQDGHVNRSLPNPSFGCNEFERLMPVGENRFLAISKNEIAAIDIEDLTLAWKFDAGWTIEDIGKFRIDSISKDHWYVRAAIDKKIKGYILRKETGEMIMTFEADQSLRGSNFLALSIDNKISIFK